jgi:hypothetical protein
MQENIIDQKIKSSFYNLLDPCTDTELQRTQLLSQWLVLIVNSRITRYSEITIYSKFIDILLKSEKASNFDINAEYEKFMLDIKNAEAMEYQVFDLARIMITDYKYPLKIIGIELVCVKDLELELQEKVKQHLIISEDNIQHMVISKVEVMAVDGEEAVHQFLSNILEVHGLLALFWDSKVTLSSRYKETSSSLLTLAKNEDFWIRPCSPSSGRLRHDFLLDLNQARYKQLEKYKWLNQPESDDKKVKKVRRALYWYGNAVSHQGDLTFLSLNTALEIIIQENDMCDGDEIARRVAVSLSDEDNDISDSYKGVKSIYKKRNDMVHRGFTHKEDYYLLQKTQEYVRKLLIYALDELSNIDMTIEKFEGCIKTKTDTHKDLLRKAKEEWDKENLNCNQRRIIKY